MDNLVSSLIAGVVSGSVISAIVGLVFHRRTTRIEEEIRSQFQSGLEIFRSRRGWKEQSVAELLGPVYMQLDRTKSAFGRWRDQNFYLEAKVIGEGNRTIRNLLLEKGHLIPPNLLKDAGKLIEHYDYWLEMYESKRLAESPDLKTKFIFAGPQGYPFPRVSAQRFQQTFLSLWNELYGGEADEIGAQSVAEGNTAASR
jgi:hypothetical protein